MKRFTVVVHPEEGGFVASVPALPGCTTEGASREEALLYVRDAIRLYLEDLLADGEPVPDDIIPEVVAVEVEVPAPSA